MSFDEMLKNLQRDYLQSLPEKISDIQKHISAGSAVEMLQDAFHKLKGTGKTYGIPEISVLAAAVEGICHDKPKQAAPAASQALLILQDIHSARNANLQFSLDDDPRFKQIRRLNN